tara:strand:+ start:4422 stop:4667 length:246 start_codon:yes stop_codon:yes gene_type:complete
MEEAKGDGRMIDTDNVKGGYCSKQEMIFYLNAVEEVKKIRGIIKNALTFLEGSTRMSDTVKLKFLIDDIRRYVLHEGDEEE